VARWLAAQEVHLHHHHHHHHPPMSKGGRIQDMMMCQESSVSWVAQIPPSMQSLIGVNLMKTCSTFIAKKETIAYKVEGREMEKRT
jgi:hypothetical protein